MTLKIEPLRWIVASSQAWLGEIAQGVGVADRVDPIGAIRQDKG
jgi:hypothetical protein